MNGLLESFEKLENKIPLVLDMRPALSKFLYFQSDIFDVADIGASVCLPMLECCCGRETVAAVHGATNACAAKTAAAGTLVLPQIVSAFALQQLGPSSAALLLQKLGVDFVGDTFEEVGAEKCGALFQELGIDFCVELFGASEFWVAELFEKLQGQFLTDLFEHCGPGFIADLLRGLGTDFVASLFRELGTSFAAERVK